ncbi:MAG: hypothetical protein ABIJ86_06435 [Spirochaetota bacterium]
MSIFVTVEDQEGEPKVDAFELEGIFRYFPKEGGCCLRFINEADDTSFNPAQGTELLVELEAVAAAIAASGKELKAPMRSELDRLLGVCGKHAGKKNTYIHFYGEAKSGADS